MSLTVTPTAAWEPIEQGLHGLNSEHRRLEDLVDELLVELDRQQDRLIACETELSRQSELLTDRERQLAEQRTEHQRLTGRLEQHEGQLSQTLAHLESVQRLLSEEAVTSDADDAPLRVAMTEVLDELRKERDALRDQLAAAHEQLSRLSELAIDLRSVHEGLREPGGGHAPAETVQRLATIELEKGELEAELDHVRLRAVELQETVERQRRELHEQREEFGAELRELRHWLETNTESLVRRATATLATAPAGDPTAGGARPAESAAAANTDVVVNSVIAQFAKLQRDVAERRKRLK